MQTNIFEIMMPQYKIKNPIRLIELFGGVGSQAKALANIKVKFSHYRLCDFDKYAIASYNAIHGTNFVTSDITKLKGEDLGIVDTNKYEYIMTYSFPCQDLSLAGKLKGMAKGSGTRSGLLWEVERLLDECLDLPQILLMENVPQVINKDFHEWQLKLESLGYSNYTDILNAKDYGIPQNRNRCYMVSILGEYYYNFPKPIPLKIRLKDMLEYNVDEKYYLSEKMIKYIKADNEKWTGNNNKALVNKTIASTINTGEGSRRCDASNYIIPNIDIDNVNIKEVVNLYKMGVKGYNRRTGSVINSNNISPTLLARVQGDNGLILETQKQFNYGNKALNETLEKRQIDSGYFIDSYNRQVHKNLAGTITTRDSESNNTFVAVDSLTNLRIRKLTPKECWRLMGFDDEDYEKASKVNSNAQLYKQSGNSIVVNVLEAIFKELL